MGKTGIHFLIAGVLSFGMVFSSTGAVDVTTEAPGQIQRDLVKKELSRIKGDVSAYVIQDGLSSPDGLAIHPQSGEIYVTEEQAGQVSVIRNGERHVVIDRGWQVEDDLPAWAKRRHDEKALLRNSLHSPEGLAFDKAGNLYVTEDAQSGRLLKFIPDATGNYTKAQVLPIPWMERPYAWEGITVSSKGRVYLAGSVENGMPGLYFGTVLTRDPEGSWSVIDFGPFAAFSAVALSADEEILVVADEISGGVIWWDVIRQRVIGAVSETLPYTEGVAVLPDGSILITQESHVRSEGNEDKMMGGRLLRVNPQTGTLKVLAEGFGTIESVVYSEKTGHLYVSEDSSGQIIEVQMNAPLETSQYLLKRSVSAREFIEGMAPKKWPPFLKSFFNNLGVPTQDESVDGEVSEADQDNAFTLSEIAERMPLIAGKIKTELSEPPTENQDPVSEVDFIVFFPSKSIQGDRLTTPGLGLFAAKRHSGKVEKTRVISGYKSSTYLGGGEWKDDEGEGMVYLPLPACTASRRGSDGMDINVCFLGMGEYEDYFLNLSLGKEESGTLVTEGSEEGTMSYGVNFTEKLSDGSEVKNVVVAGFNHVETHDYEWMKLGSWPMGSGLDVTAGIKTFSSRTEALLELVEVKDAEWKFAMDEQLEKKNRLAERPAEAVAEEPADEAAAEGVEPGPTVEDDTPGVNDDEKVIREEDEDKVESGPSEEEDAAAAWKSSIFSKAIEQWMEDSF